MKILVLGAAGMLGHKMFQVLDQKFPNSVWGTIRQEKKNLSSLVFKDLTRIKENFDIENDQDLLTYLNDLKPDYIINCIGITLRKEDQQSTFKNLNINALLPQKLALWCEQNQKKLIHFSTDCVFDGHRGHYLESDYPNAQDLYGASKYLGEIRQSPAALTLRLSIVGRELSHKTELVEWFFSKRKQTIEGYSEVFYTGLTTLFVAHEVVRIIQKFPELTGLYQVSSEKISKFELLNILNQQFRTECQIKKNDQKKSDKSLNCDRYIEKTGFIKPRWVDMISDLRKDNELYESL